MLLRRHDFSSAASVGSSAGKAAFWILFAAREDGGAGGSDERRLAATAEADEDEDAFSHVEGIAACRGVDAAMFLAAKALNGEGISGAETGYSESNTDGAWKLECVMHTIGTMSLEEEGTS